MKRSQGPCWVAPLSFLPKYEDPFPTVGTTVTESLNDGVKHVNWTLSPDSLPECVQEIQLDCLAGHDLWRQCRELRERARVNPCSFKDAHHYALLITKVFTRLTARKTHASGCTVSAIRYTRRVEEGASVTEEAIDASVFPWECTIIGASPRFLIGGELGFEVGMSWLMCAAISLQQAGAVLERMQPVSPHPGQTLDALWRGEPYTLPAASGVVRYEPEQMFAEVAVAEDACRWALEGMTKMSEMQETRFQGELDIDVVKNVRSLVHIMHTLMKCYLVLLSSGKTAGGFRTICDTVIGQYIYTLLTPLSCREYLGAVTELKRSDEHAGGSGSDDDGGGNSETESVGKEGDDASVHSDTMCSVADSTDSGTATIGAPMHGDEVTLGELTRMKSTRRHALSVISVLANSHRLISQAQRLQTRFSVATVTLGTGLSPWLGGLLTTCLLHAESMTFMLSLWAHKALTTLPSHEERARDSVRAPDAIPALLRVLFHDACRAEFGAPPTKTVVGPWFLSVVARLELAEAREAQGVEHEAEDAEEAMRRLAAMLPCAMLLPKTLEPVSSLGGVELPRFPLKSVVALTQECEEVAMAVANTCPGILDALVESCKEALSD